MDDKSRQALERFGRTLVERVRDASISDCEMIVDGQAKAKALAELYARLGALSEEQRRAIHELIIKCVDNTMHHMLWMLDQEEWLNVAVDTDAGTVPSLREISDGLIGDKFDWIERFSKKPQPI